MWIEKHTQLVISTLLSTLKDFSKSQAVMYTGKVVIQCILEMVPDMLYQKATNRKWYLYMTYLITAIVMTLSVLEGDSPIVCLFKCDILYLWHVAWSVCICRASCLWIDNGKWEYEVKTVTGNSFQHCFVGKLYLWVSEVFDYDMGVTKYVKFAALQMFVILGLRL